MTIKELPLIYNVDKVAVYNKRGLVSSFWRDSKFGLAEQVERYRIQLSDSARNATNEKIESMSICISGIADNVVTLEIYLK
jgi:hypothetical protein